MDPLDKGAGGIDDLNPLPFQPLINILRNTVGADDDCLPGLRLLRRVDDLHAQSAKLVHHMAVVDDGSKGHYLRPRSSGLFHQIHRPADAKAEPGTLGYPDAHWATFFATISRMAATTSSRVMSLVSTLMLSRDIFRGATSRWVS